MSKKKSSLSDLFSAVTLSEPLKTFKSNIEALDALARMSSHAVERGKGEVEKWRTEDRQLKKDTERSLQECKGSLKQLYEVRRWVKPSKRLAGGGKGQLDEQENRVNEAIKARRALITKEKALIDRWDSLCKNYSTLLDRYDRQSQMLMPMVFVYLVAIWDAFIVDTARRILRVHPQLILTSDDKIEVSKSFLWHANNINGVQDYLIEHKVRQLDSDRKELVKTFRDYWGIDWEKSGIPLKKVIEIRARRGIWVHNKGKVNERYLTTVGKETSYKAGQLAEITEEYLQNSKAILTKLAVYIHGIAHKKHYARTDYS